MIISNYIRIYYILVITHTIIFQLDMYLYIDTYIVKKMRYLKLPVVI